jgi:hypothetical protein
LLDFVDELDVGWVLRVWFLLMLDEGEELLLFEGGATTFDNYRYIATPQHHKKHHEHSA